MHFVNLASVKEGRSHSIHLFMKRDLKPVTGLVQMNRLGHYGYTMRCGQGWMQRAHCMAIKSDMVFSGEPHGSWMSSPIFVAYCIQKSEYGGVGVECDAPQ